jgi:general secretion pathway protein D
LFKSQSRKRTKTNLMIFLRPVIVSNAKGSDLLTQERYEGMRALEDLVQPKYNRLLPVNGAPRLPDWRSDSLNNDAPTPAVPMMQPTWTLSQPSLAK